MGEEEQEEEEEEEEEEEFITQRGESRILSLKSSRTTHDAQACIEMRCKSDALSAECPSGKSALSAECPQVLKKFCALSSECLSDIVFQLKFKVSTQHRRWSC